MCQGAGIAAGRSDAMVRNDNPRRGRGMSHTWIFDMLRDLRAYALANGLPAVAAKAEETLRVAEAEIAAQPGRGSAPGREGGPDRAH